MDEGQCATRLNEKYFVVAATEFINFGVGLVGPLWVLLVFPPTACFWLEKALVKHGQQKRRAIYGRSRLRSSGQSQEAPSLGGVTLGVSPFPRWFPSAISTTTALFLHGDWLATAL